MSQIGRQRGICAAAIIAVLLSSSPSDAQPWPQRTVRAIVPFPPGSSPDIVARVFAERLAARWGQAVIVENLPGAEGFTGTATFAAPRDDHALLFAPAAPIAVYPLLHEKLSYDPARDIVPVAAITNTFGAIAVPASLQGATLPELVEYARPTRLARCRRSGARRPRYDSLPDRQSAACRGIAAAAHVRFAPIATQLLHGINPPLGNPAYQSQTRCAAGTDRSMQPAAIKPLRVSVAPDVP